MAARMTRRILMGTLGAGVVGLPLDGVGAKGAPADTILEAVDTEFARLFRRALADPTDASLLTSVAGMFRVLDAVATVHSLKRHQKRARPVDEGEATERAARHLRQRGFSVTGDELLRRRLEAPSRGTDVDAAAKDAALAMTSDALFRNTAAVFEAASAAVRHLPARTIVHPDYNIRPASSYNACGWYRAYGGRWGFLLGTVAFGFLFVPELELVGAIYAGASLYFDGATVYCEF